MDAIDLQVPARPDFVHVLRSVMAGVAARQNLSVDDIEDLRLAVDEACAYLLGIPAQKSVLRMTILPDSGGLEVIASVDAASGAASQPEAQQSVMWHILAALTDEARFEERDGPAIRIIKRIPV